ncbi:unnamed protein product [Danaus chrysippus]|uniref:(African queen) hypothetical protein n=1 Tax=Danaus chrysippus TaxID=151541 RepID=A0A8J2WAM0_9NEOP|nr:unnamed protein product [Danaus chrysippus]
MFTLVRPSASIGEKQEVKRKEKYRVCDKTVIDRSVGVQLAASQRRDDDYYTIRYNTTRLAAKWTSLRGKNESFLTTPLRPRIMQFNFNLRSQRLARVSLGVWRV